MCDLMRTLTAFLIFAGHMELKNTNYEELPLLEYNQNPVLIISGGPHVINVNEQTLFPFICSLVLYFNQGIN